MAKKSDQKPKPPVVTIMGHVDHGKTTLLDQIRKSSVTAGEHGGITQHIGAYQIEHKGSKITFIDTPGHAAFSKMRSHGAKATDIAILVVAADDGVKPQTRESIKHILAAGVPLIVAVNKIDVKGAVPDMAKAQLVEEGVNVEGYGGTTPVVEISAKEGTNIDKLLETITVLAELEELTADPQGPLEAVVIESNHNKRTGVEATLLVNQGTLHQGDKLVSVLAEPEITGSAKRILSDLEKDLKQAGPSTPVQLIGLKDAPAMGTILTTPEHRDKVADKLQKLQEKAQKAKAKTKTGKVAKTEEPEETSEASEDSDEEPISINIILRSDTAGTLEAIKQNLGEEVNIIDSAIGQVTESDVLHAIDTESVIIAFNVKTAPAAKKLARIERVPIQTYNIIYKLLEDFEKAILKLLEPTIDEEEISRSSVLANFEIRGTKIAGCSVDSGTLTVNSNVHLKRDTKIIADARVVSIKQGKVEVSSVEAGNECGIVLKPQLDTQIGDKIISYKMKEEA